MTLSAWGLANQRQLLTGRGRLLLPTCAGPREDQPAPLPAALLSPRPEASRAPGPGTADTPCPPQAPRAPGACPAERRRSPAHTVRVPRSKSPLLASLRVPASASALPLGPRSTGPEKPKETGVGCLQDCGCCFRRRPPCLPLLPPSPPCPPHPSRLPASSSTALVSPTPDALRSSGSAPCWGGPPRWGGRWQVLNEPTHREPSFPSAQLNLECLFFIFFSESYFQYSYLTVQPSCHIP